jgi:hypothetical protein
MLGDIADTFGRIGGFFVRAPLRALRGATPARADATVTLLVRDNDTHPIPGAKMRLVFAGNAVDIVTDEKGRAAFATKVALERRWFWVNVGFTGLLAPHLMDRLALDAELDHTFRGDAGVDHFPVLYRMNIYRSDDGDCWNPGARVFARDTDGHFTIDLDRGNKTVPLGGKMLTVPNNAYRATGSFDPRENPVTVDLEFLQERWALAQ